VIEPITFAAPYDTCILLTRRCKDREWDNLKLKNVVNITSCGTYGEMREAIATAEPMPVKALIVDSNKV
jgi:hypothetical protein